MVRLIPATKKKSEPTTICFNSLNGAINTNGWYDVNSFLPCFNSLNGAINILKFPSLNLKPIAFQFLNWCD